MPAKINAPEEDVIHFENSITIVASEEDWKNLMLNMKARGEEFIFDPPPSLKKYLMDDPAESTMSTENISLQNSTITITESNLEESKGYDLYIDKEEEPLIGSGDLKIYRLDIRAGDGEESTAYVSESCRDTFLEEIEIRDKYIQADINEDWEKEDSVFSDDAELTAKEETIKWCIVQQLSLLVQMIFNLFEKIRMLFMSYQIRSTIIH